MDWKVLPPVRWLSEPWLMPVFTLVFAVVVLLRVVTAPRRPDRAADGELRKPSATSLRPIHDSNTQAGKHAA